MTANRTIGIVVLAMVMPGIADAQSELVGSISSPVSITNTLQWTIGLLVVLLVIFGCALLLKRITGFSSSATGVLKVLGGVSLGHRERAILLQFRDKQLLLGVTPGNIRTLFVVDETYHGIDADQNGASGGDMTFDNSLRQVIEEKLHDKT